MNGSELLKQSLTEALFPKVLWQRPQSLAAGGRVLIIGGAAGHIAGPEAAYQGLVAARVGECAVAVPDSLAKLLAGTGIARALPATPAGSLARVALAGALDLASEYDSVLLAPMAGNNSETVILLEALLEKLSPSRVICGDAFHALRLMPELAKHDDQVIMGTMNELFALTGWLGQPIKLLPDAAMMNKLEVMKALIRAAPQTTFVLVGPDLIVATAERFSVTGIPRDTSGLEWGIIGALAAFWTQHPRERFEGLTTAALVIGQTLARMSTPLTVTSFCATLERTLAQISE